MNGVSWGVSQAQLRYWLGCRTLGFGVGCRMDFRGGSLPQWAGRYWVLMGGPSSTRWGGLSPWLLGCPHNLAAGFPQANDQGAVSFTTQPWDTRTRARTHALAILD